MLKAIDPRSSANPVKISDLVCFDEIVNTTASRVFFAFKVSTDD